MQASQHLFTGKSTSKLIHWWIWFRFRDVTQCFFSTSFKTNIFYFWSSFISKLKMIYRYLVNIFFCFFSVETLTKIIWTTNNSCFQVQDKENIISIVSVIISMFKVVHLLSETVIKYFKIHLHWFVTQSHKSIFSSDILSSRFFSKKVLSS